MQIIEVKTKVPIAKNLRKTSETWVSFSNFKLINRPSHCYSHYLENKNTSFKTDR